MDDGAVRLIGLDDVEALARGCSVLGTGGGGATYPAQLMLRQAIEDHGPVRLVGLEDLPPDGLVMPIGTIGAPTVGLEKLPSGRETSRIRDHVEAQLGAPVAAVMSVEIGGGNGVEPAARAAALCLPLVDADGMGRAFPEVQMVAMNVAGRQIGLVVLGDARGNLVSIRPIDADWGERIARAATTALGSTATEVDYVLRARDARGAVIEGTVTRAIAIGRAVEGAGDHPVAALVSELGAAVLVEGRIVDVERRTAGGFVRGSATIEEIGGGRTLRLEIQNENLVALEDGRLVASVPDLIAVLDTQTADAVPTEVLRYGHRVTVIAFACDPLWRSPRGLEVAGPRAFGYEVDYVPVEELHVLT